MKDTLERRGEIKAITEASFKKQLVNQPVQKFIKDQFQGNESEAFLRTANLY